jgi:hypothetical protein
MNYSKRFVVEPGANVDLHKIDPGYIDPEVTEQDALAETKKLRKRLIKLQASLYCEKQRSVLIVLQALDTGGAAARGLSRRVAQGATADRRPVAFQL